MELTAKQKKELGVKLNVSPESLWLHDNMLINYQIKDGCIKFRFALGEYGYCCNEVELAGYWEDIKNNYFVVDETFYGVDNLNIKTDEYFSRYCCDILGNFTTADGKIRFEFSSDTDGGEYDTSVTIMEFEYQSFEFEAFGEVDGREVINAEDSLNLPPDEWHWLLKL